MLIKLVLAPRNSFTNNSSCSLSPIPSKKKKNHQPNEPWTIRKPWIRKQMASTWSYRPVSCTSVKSDRRMATKATSAEPSTDWPGKRDFPLPKDVSWSQVSRLFTQPFESYPRDLRSLGDSNVAAVGTVSQFCTCTETKCTSSFALLSNWFYNVWWWSQGCTHSAYV